MHRYEVEEERMTEILNASFRNMNVPIFKQIKYFIDLAVF